MEFVGYTSEQMLYLVNTIFVHDNNYVFNDDGHIKLAIKLPINQNYALFVWDDFNVEDEQENRLVIQSKIKETIRFFQETVGLINNNLQTNIFHDIETIVTQNGTIERFQNNINTEIIENKDYVSFEWDIRRNIWLVNIRNILSFSLNNENSARRVYQLVSKDISNYNSFRWGRPQLINAAFLTAF